MDNLQFKVPEMPKMQSLQAQQQQPQQGMTQQSENPFNLAPYNNIRMPDSPISYGGGLADSMLNDNEVPEDVRTRNWFVFHKDNTLSFLDEERKRSKMLNFDIVKIDTLNAMAYYDYDFHVEKEFNMLRNVFETKLDRALGIKGNIKNERIVLQSQFTEARQISEQGFSSSSKEGFFKKLFGRR